MSQTPAQLFSSGLETASLAVTSGLLSRSWKFISDLNADTHADEDLFWKKVSYDSDLTIIAFGTSRKDVRPDLLPSSNFMENPFEFLCSQKNPSFSFNEPAISLFIDHHSQLRPLKDEIDLKKPVIVTGNAVGGSIASLFTLWLSEKMGPADKRPLCITFGSPLIGDQSLQEAISRSSNWNSCFLHVVSHRDPLPPSLISSSNNIYRPFGTFLLCSDHGSACSENPASILKLLNETRPQNHGQYYQDYGNVVENLNRKAICKDSDGPNIAHPNVLQASLALQLWTLLQQIDEKNLKELEREEVLLILKKRKQFIPNKKLDEMKTYMAQLEWYKKTSKNQKRGYYDSYRNDRFTSDLDVVLFVKILNNYWKDMVDEVEKQPMREGAAFRTRWLYAGTNYRRMVEPLDIAHYYKDGGRQYIELGRSQHYKKLEQWLEEDKKPKPKSRGNVRSILTVDSCFWAHVEEALISCQKLKAAGSSELEKQEALKSLEKFEKYVYGLLKDYAVSPEIFLDESSYMRWWNEYMKIKEVSHDSQLASFMKNPTNYETYAEGAYDFP